LNFKEGFSSGCRQLGLAFYPAFLLLPNACNAEVKIETSVAAAILDEETLHLKVIAKDD